MSISTESIDFDRDMSLLPEIADYITEATGFHGFLEKATNIHYKGRTYTIVQTNKEIEGYVFDDPTLDYIEDAQERPLIIVIMHIIALVILSVLTLIALAIRESMRAGLNMTVYHNSNPPSPRDAPLYSPLPEPDEYPISS